MDLLVPTPVGDMRKGEIEQADFLQVGQQDRNLFSDFSFGRLLNGFSLFDLPARIADQHRVAVVQFAEQLSASRIRRAAKRREISIVKDSFSAWAELHIYRPSKPQKHRPLLEPRSTVISKSRNLSFAIDRRKMRNEKW